VSTLNEIAANHARMAKALEESTRLSERQTVIVDSFEAPSMEAQHMPLHLIVAAQDNHFGQVPSY